MADAGIHEAAGVFNDEKSLQSAVDAWPAGSLTT